MTDEHIVKEIFPSQKTLRALRNSKDFNESVNPRVVRVLSATIKTKGTAPVVS